MCDLQSKHTFILVQAKGAYHDSVLAGQTSLVKTEILLLMLIIVPLLTANPNQSVINSDVLSAKLAQTLLQTSTIGLAGKF